MKRVRRLVYPQAPSGAWALWFSAAMLIATAAVGLAAWQSQPIQRSSAVSQAGREDSSAYDKWLNQDVVYIISEEERDAFQKLTADEEREKFIEQFWLRRDPTPGTAQNEFKEEHYRRIAYANERFAASEKAGWQTDRGRIYIQWGPPDEIESHPAGNADTPPYEVWRYHRVKGVGEEIFVRFVDQARTGDYRRMPGMGR